jgi:DNA-binding transcriptional MocR family regulator
MVDTRYVVGRTGVCDATLTAFGIADFEGDGVAAPAVTVTHGALDAIERILREHLRVGDRVAVEDPSSPAILDLVSASAFVPIPFALDEAGPRPEAFEEALGHGSRAVIVTPRAQNPTGAAISGERAEQLRRVLRKFPDVLLIEDDGAAPVAGAPLHTLRGGAQALWAFVRSTSTFLGPDLRVAVVSGDDITLSRLVERQTLGACWVSHLLQRLVLALWSDPANGRRFARAAEFYAARRRALRSELTARDIRSFGESGFNVWVPVTQETTVVQALGERGWAVAAGERFRLASPPGIRITTSTLDPADAPRLAADLAAVLRPAPAALTRRSAGTRAAGG